MLPKRQESELATTLQGCCTPQQGFHFLRDQWIDAAAKTNSSHFVSDKESACCKEGLLVIEV